MMSNLDGKVNDPAVCDAIASDLSDLWETSVAPDELLVVSTPKPGRYIVQMGSAALNSNPDYPDPADAETGSVVTFVVEQKAGKWVPVE